MSFLIPLALFGWLPISIYLFHRLKAHQAVLAIVIGGTLILPTVGYDFSGVPSYTKGAAIAYGLLLGGEISGKRRMYSLTLGWLDLPMIIWCLCPLATSLSNNLGIYDGISGAVNIIISWGIPYFIGKMYFKDIQSCKDVCLAIMIGGIFYIPLCLFEVRMSPQLSNIVYGFFPHSWIQHIRGGHFRPIVFMQHGLMVSFWIAVASINVFWLWRSRLFPVIKGVSTSLLFLILAITCFLCRSMNGLFFLIFGICLYKRVGLLMVLLLSVPSYMMLKMNDFIVTENLIDIAGYFVNEERVASLEYRLHAEDLYLQKSMENPLVGWGGYGRGDPIDPDTEKPYEIATDSYFLITMSRYGLVGLVASCGAMLLGPFLTLKYLLRCGSGNLGTEREVYPMYLSLVVIFFMIDCLVNYMLNPTYVLIAGVLLNANNQLSKEMVTKKNT